MQIAEYKILYNNVNITNDISQSLISIEYADKVAGESDELTIKLEDAKGLWKNEWYPEKGATLVASFTQDGQTLNCGTFEIDEIDVFGSRNEGDYVTIKALGAGIKQGVRTRKNATYKDNTLRQIADSIASKFGYTVQGTVPNVKLGYVVQNRETDLEFLSRISAPYGVQFSVKGKILVFISIFDLEGMPSIATFRRTDLVQYDIKDKTSHIYIVATSIHYVPKTKKTVKQSSNAKASPYSSSDYLLIDTKSENDQQAALKAKALLYRNNSLEQEGNIIVPGNIILCAGVNIQLEEMGTSFSGIYHTIGSKHKVDRSGGYVTTADIKRVGAIARELTKQQDV